MLTIKNKNKYLHEEGFTLVELLVATSIFAIVAIGAISVLLGAQTAYKRISNNRIAIDNINLVLDSMSREIKFGTNYGCINQSGNFSSSLYYLSFSSSTVFGDSVGNNCNAVSFIPQGSNNKRMVYYFDTENKTINEVDYEFLGGNYINKSDFPITSKDLNIDVFWLNIKGTTDTDYLQPSVQIYISGIMSFVKNGQNNIVSTTTFSGQTTVSQRILDN